MRINFYQLQVPFPISLKEMLPRGKNLLNLTLLQRILFIGNCIIKEFYRHFAFFKWKFVSCIIVDEVKHCLKLLLFINLLMLSGTDL